MNDEYYRNFSGTSCGGNHLYFVATDSANRKVRGNQKSFPILFEWAQNFKNDISKNQVVDEVMVIQGVYLNVLVQTFTSFKIRENDSLENAIV